MSDSQEPLINVQGLKSALSSATLGPDWASIENMARDFVLEAKKISVEAAIAVAEHQQKIFEVLTRTQAGDYDQVACRRAIARHQRSITNYFEGVREKINWKTAETFWKAADELVNWALVLASKVLLKI